MQTQLLACTELVEGGIAFIDMTRTLKEQAMLRAILTAVCTKQTNLVGSGRAGGRRRRRGREAEAKLGRKAEAWATRTGDGDGKAVQGLMGKVTGCSLLPQAAHREPP